MTTKPYVTPITPVRMRRFLRCKPLAQTRGRRRLSDRCFPTPSAASSSFSRSSQSSIDKFLSGEDEEVHKVALATQQAELSFDLFLQVRNKVVSAYQEVMRMQM